MFDTIILLAGTADHTLLSTVLKGYHPKLMVHPVFTADDLAAIEPELLRRARLVSFSSTQTVPPAVLAALGYGAYHFHIGSPEYPGRTPAHAALSDRATQFGATVHRLVGEAEAGPIVDVELFAVPAEASAAGLNEIAYGLAIQMLWRLAPRLATQASPLVERAVRWGRVSAPFAPCAASAAPSKLAKAINPERARSLAADLNSDAPFVPMASAHGMAFHRPPSHLSPTGA